MTITKRMYDIPVGTIIYRSTGDIVITSEYDGFHGWYYCNDIEYDDNGDGLEIDNGNRVTPADLIGDMVYF